MYNYLLTISILFRKKLVKEYTFGTHREFIVVNLIDLNGHSISVPKRLSTYLSHQHSLIMILQSCGICQPQEIAKE